MTQLLEIIDGALSENEAWSYVMDEYATWLQNMRLAGAWTVAPRRGKGGWYIEAYKEEN